MSEGEKSEDTSQDLLNRIKSLEERVTGLQQVIGDNREADAMQLAFTTLSNTNAQLMEMLKAFMGVKAPE